MKTLVKQTIFAIVSLALFASCQKQEMNIRGTLGDITPSDYLKSEVYVIKEDVAKKAVKSYDEEKDILKISDALDKDELPSEGNIIASAITEQIPYGLLARVVSIEKDGDSWVLHLKDAALDEVFEDLQIDTVITFTEENIGIFYDADGNVIEVNKPVTRTSGDDDDNEKADKDEVVLETIVSEGEFSVGLNVTHKRFGGKGSLSYGGTIGYRNNAFRINLLEAEKFYYSIEPYLTLNASIAAQVEKEFFADDKPVVLYRHQLAPVTVWVYGVPIVFRPQFIVSLDSTLSAAAKFKTDFNLDAGIFMMMKYDGGWKYNVDPRTNLGENRIPFTVAELELDGFLGSSLIMEYFYGVYGRDFGCGLTGKLNVGNNASFTLNSDLDNILDINPVLNQEISLNFGASFRSEVWGIELLPPLDVEAPEISLYEQSISLFPRFKTFNPVEKDGNYVLRYDVDERSINTLLGNPHGWTLFDENKEEVYSNYSDAGNPISQYTYRYEQQIERLTPGKKYYVAPMAEFAGHHLYGKKVPLEADRTVKFHFRCASREYDVLTFTFDLSKASSNSIDVRYDATDYDGSPMSMHVTGQYNTDTQVFSGAVDFLFYNDPGQQRVDGFSIDMSTGDSGYVYCTKIVDNNGCDAAVRISDVTAEQSASLTTKSINCESCTVGIYNPNY